MSAADKKDKEGSSPRSGGGGGGGVRGGGEGKRESAGSKSTSSAAGAGPKAPDKKETSTAKTTGPKSAPQTGPAGPVTKGAVKSAAPAPKGISQFSNRAKEQPAPTRFKDPGVAGVPQGVEARNQKIIGKDRLIDPKLGLMSSKVAAKYGGPFAGMKTTAVSQMIGFADHLRAKGYGPISPVSGYRDQATQNKIRANATPASLARGDVAKVGEHVKGTAFDAVVPGMTPAQLAKEALAYGGFGRIRGYGEKGHTHFGTKPQEKTIVSGSFGPGSLDPKGSMKVADFAAEGRNRKGSPPGGSLGGLMTEAKASPAPKEKATPQKVAAKEDPRGLMQNAPRPKEFKEAPVKAPVTANLSRNPFDTQRGIAAPPAIGKYQDRVLAEAPKQVTSPMSTQGALAPEVAQAFANYGKYHTKPSVVAARNPAPKASPPAKISRNPFDTQRGTAPPKSDLLADARSKFNAEIPMTGAPGEHAYPGMSPLKDQSRVPKEKSQARVAPQAPHGLITDAQRKSLGQTPMAGAVDGPALKGFTNMSKERIAAKRELDAIAGIGQPPEAAPRDTASVVQHLLDKAAQDVAYMDDARAHRKSGQPKQLPTKPVPEKARKVLTTAGGLLTGLPMGPLSWLSNKGSELANKGRLGNRPGQPYALGSNHAISKAFEGKDKDAADRAVARRPRRTAQVVTDNPFQFPTENPVFPVS